MKHGRRPRAANRYHYPRPRPAPQRFSGLTGEYINNRDLTNFALRRLDPKIDFNFGTGSPDPSIGVSTFSARWTGHVVPRFTETYNFHTITDDGVRLWVDDQLIIDRWSDQSATERTGSITLRAGVRHAVRMEYYENTGSAVARLLWSSPSQPREVVPTSQLFPD